MMISEPTPFSHPFNFNDMQRVHPLSASPGASAFFRATSPVQSTSTNNMDDVTTIFVVGFPEDMGEREFQNMFTFCQGFEAASLKWHCKDGEEETIPSNGGKKQMIGFARFRTRLEALEAIDVLSGKRIDQEKGTVLKAEMAKKNLHIKRGSATQQTSTSTSSTTSTTSTNVIGITSTTAAGVAAAAVPTAVIAPVAATPIHSNIMIASSEPSSHLKSSRYDTFSPLPSDLFSSQDYKNNDLFVDNHHHHHQQQQHHLHHHPITAAAATNTAASSSSAFDDSLFGIRSQSFDQDLGFLSSRAFGLGPSIQQHNLHHQHTQPQQQHLSPSPSQHQHNNIHQHIHQHQQAQQIQQQQIRLPSKMMNEIDSDPYHYLSKSTPVPTDSNNNRFDDHDLMRLGSLSINTTTAATNNNNNNSNNNNDTPNSSSLLLRSPSLSSPRLPNPADQNPPCNTLYVGNLPPNTSEEELRQVFSNCKGYRRMCFRTKPQGPMCFVEFEDIVFASQALNELQGQNLTNSVKGGIRLSYSKNPLFIKPNKGNGSSSENGLMSFKQMGNALMSSEQRAPRDFMFDPQL